MTNDAIQVVVDGMRVEARPGQTLLAVCRRAGKDIPTLCHHESMEPYAACRVCLVEIVAGGRKAIVPSCQYPVTEPLEVATDSEPVQVVRRTVLELLLARCPGSEVVKSLAARFGVTRTPYPSDDPQQTCILCGLCVRACEEQLRIGAIGFSSRGVERTVGPPFGASSAACIGCLACVAVCPTGHVRTADHGAVRSMETWHTELEMAKCPSCGRPYAPKKMLALLRARLPVEPAEEEACPACRRSHTAGRLQQLRSLWNVSTSGQECAAASKAGARSQTECPEK